MVMLKGVWEETRAVECLEELEEYILSGVMDEPLDLALVRNCREIV